MANIVAPSLPSSPYYIGKGLRGNNGNVVNIFGQPLPNDGVLGTNNLTRPVGIVNATTYFDVTGYFVNTEIPVVLYVSPNSIYSSVNYTVTWYRERDTTVVFQHNYTLVSPPNGSYSPGSVYFAWIGWLFDNMPGLPTYPMYREIQENGNYYAIISASGGENFTSPKINFVVVGITPSVILEDPTTNGFMIRLSNYFDTSNYIRAGICLNEFTDGQSTPPNGIVGSVNASSSSNACIAKTVAEGLNSGTQYGIYGFTQAANGLYYRAGWTLIRTLGALRPSNWSWSTPKTSGQPFNLTATEWNQFTDAINGFRTYQNLVTLSFTTAPYEVDKLFWSWMFNQALTGIRGGELGGYYYDSLKSMNNSFVSRLPTNRSIGDNIMASYFNDMRDAINSIP
ncbi:hypothetical protein [Paenibacillus sp. FSL H8-0034]|uniref:hypothetical protein n=1 Tax=Paenibacillus sp. FSL H8-0034 TaxID=2954671 RepID=UPI0030F7AD29